MNKKKKENKGDDGKDGSENEVVKGCGRIGKIKNEEKEDDDSINIGVIGEKERKKIMGK